MQPNPYAYNPYANGTQMPVRYAIPPGFRQPSPLFTNQSFDRYPAMPQPMHYPPGYHQPGMPMPSAANMMPVGSPTRPQQQQQPQQRKPPEQLQPPQPYYYNPYAANGGNPSMVPGPRAAAPPKKGAKEYKDNAFTIAPSGAHAESIKGLVSNNDINDLLKHKGTKIKVSKIYRITKTKPAAVNDSSDDELPPKVQQPTPALASAPAPVPQPVQRPVSSSSSDSHCSTCSNCSCSDCRGRRRSHKYDDCPECQAELKREEARRRRRRR